MNDKVTELLAMVDDLCGTDPTKWPGQGLPVGDMIDQRNASFRTLLPLLAEMVKHAYSVCDNAAEGWSEGRNVERKVFGEVLRDDLDRRAAAALEEIDDG